MNNHSRISPSSSQIWAAPNGCTGYVKMMENVVDEGTKYSREGDAAHELASFMFDSYNEEGEDGNPNPEEVLYFSKRYIGKVMSNGVTVDEEMYNHISAYVKDCLDTLEGATDYGVETKVHNKTIHPEFHGTVDFYAQYRDKSILRVRDLKYGFTDVSPVWNWQLLSYAIMTPYAAHYDTIILEIYQPRSYGSPTLKQWYVSAADLNYAFDNLKTKARIALSDEAKLFSGSHCKNCAARAMCPAAGKAALNAIEISELVSFENINLDIVSEEIEILRRAEEAIKLRRSGLEQQITTRIEKGEFVKGMVIEYHHGKRSWNIPPEKIQALADAYQIDLLDSPSFVSPTVAEKRGIDKAILNSFVKRTKTPKLKNTKESNIQKAFQKGIKNG